MKPITKLQIIVAIASFLIGVMFAVAGFVVSPTGQIHDSVLYLIAQFFLLCASLFGVGAVFSHNNHKI